MVLCKTTVNLKPVKYTTSTFAGGNLLGDGYNLTSLSLDSPLALFFNEQDELVFTDANTIKATSGNVIKAIAGTGELPGSYSDGGANQLALLAQINEPRGIVVSKETGDIYFSDYYNDLVRKIDMKSGKISVIAGIPGSSGFNDGQAKLSKVSRPFGIGLINSDVIFADRNNHRIRKISNGAVVTICGNGINNFGGDNRPALTARINTPTGLFVNSTNGDIYFCDSLNHRIRKIDGSTAIISTIAGNGDVGYSGDGGLATNAALNFPTGVVSTPDGTLYIIDNNNVIRMVNSSGYISTIGGSMDSGNYGDGGPAINAKFAYPTGISVSKNGDVYVTDTGNLKIRKISKQTGIIETVIGNTNVYGGDGLPASKAALGYISQVVSIDGITYISHDCRIRKVDKNQIVSTIAGNGNRLDDSTIVPNVINPLESIQSIIGLSVSPITKELFVSFSNSIYKLFWNGTLIRVAGTNGQFGGDGYNAKYSVISRATGIDFLPSTSEMIIADSLNSCIRKISTLGIITTIAGKPGVAGYSGENVRAIDSMIGNPVRVLVSKMGEIYFSTNTHRVQKISLNGNITTICGTGVDDYSGDGGNAIEAAISNPNGMAFSSDEELLYVACNGNNAIRVVNLTSGIIDIVQNVASPLDVALTNDGLYLLVLLSDSTLNNITLSTLQNSIICGTGVEGYNGDDILATDAQLNKPTSVSVDQNGDIYISDNSRLRKISNGVISTIAGNGNTTDIENDVLANMTSVVPSFSKVGPNGDLYIIDRAYIRTVSTNGIISTLAGGLGDGGLASEAYLCPNRLVVSWRGDIYFTDSCYANNIRKISYDTGIISTIAGGIYAGYNNDEIEAIKAKLNNPYGITVSVDGDIYFTDIGNNRIRRISKDGIIHAVTGNGIVLSTGDGGSALLASIINPASVITTKVGDVIFPDCDAHAIRKISALDGNISTIIGNGQTGFEMRDNVKGNETIVSCPDSIFIDEQGNLIYSDTGIFRNGLVRVAVPYCEEDGFRLSENSLICTPICYGKFGNNSCGGPSQGACVDVNLCECEIGWIGETCNITTCNGLLSNDSAVCQSRGKCLDYEKCTCDNGFSGANCEYFSCFGIQSNDPLTCNSHGQCIGKDLCECNSTWHQVPQLLNTETIARMEGMKKDKPMSDRQALNYPEEHKPMMKKLEKLCEKVGRLQAFRYHRYYECHIGGSEYEINAYGIGGVFLLVFHSEGLW
ncbi:predicted protein [Naegleria gruberi]|uniref:Predicted protein n=1 Tax=Naegleria gruberi TaxID=5762 RepID=D2VII7_NAEGR|nr:uncharacterized protein NAEGRDRAFT_49822 [Naegleria gruberi]EFC43366.1 predicted protein [Naegleria gruberi]|eukprot:XP_002676110.1 predicted protein [Naegleria gruberi strain NEG-M]